MLAPLYPPTPFVIRGRFLGLVWHQDQLRFLRVLAKGEEIQIGLPHSLEWVQLFDLHPWEWLQIEGDQIGDLCQAERIFRARSITPLRCPAPLLACR